MKFLMEAGEMVNITQSLSDEAIELIAAEFAPERELASSTPTTRSSSPRSTRTRPRI